MRKMRVSIVLLCMCVYSVMGRSARSADRYGSDNVNCENVRPFFEGKNLTAVARPEGDVSETTCGGRCCNHHTEAQLRHQAKVDFNNLIHHHSQSLQGILATTADALRETVTTLLRQSENKTLTVFEHVYSSMSVHSRPSIRSLYQAMINYVSPSNTPDSLQQPLSHYMLQERFTEFFTRLFPIAYHNAVNPEQQDFTDKFKSCLYDAIDEIQPFGDIPKQVSRSVSKSLETTRVLVQALTLGKTVLDKTDTVLLSGSSPHQAACYDALLRMTHCSKCWGHGASVPPCIGMCTNVIRGCLTGPASELDLAWSGYLDTVKRLVVVIQSEEDPLGLAAATAVRQLDTRISDAIMHAMENGPSLEEKVRKLCGRSELKPGKMAAASDAQFGGAREHSSVVASSLEHRQADVAHLNAQAHRAQSQLQSQLGKFVSSVSTPHSFYGTLADSICEGYPEQRCWNGERVGEYTKTVVDASVTAQRYNPEFPKDINADAWNYGNPNTSVLIDQLRHINQVMQSQLASAPDSGVLLSDEALDGSGSGASPNWNRGIIVNSDDEDVDDDNEASGSGMGPIRHQDTPKQPKTTTDKSDSPSSASHHTIASFVIISFVWLIHCA